MSKLDLSDLRKQYGQAQIADLPETPMVLFERWFQEQLAVESDDPNAMVLSTIDERGFPQSRVVLLKGIEEEGFIFYTNYLSAKARQINMHPKIGLLFYWPKLARQVRAHGLISKVSDALSGRYFASRPRASQLAALASMQSDEISSIQVLEQRYLALEKQYLNQDVPKPKHWGGYIVKPEYFEFWQGRNNRMHERVAYAYEDSLWHLKRLAP